MEPRVNKMRWRTKIGHSLERDDWDSGEVFHLGLFRYTCLRQHARQLKEGVFFIVLVIHAWYADDNV